MRDSVPSLRYSAFVMYCVNGKPHSSILIESTDSIRREESEGGRCDIFHCRCYE